MIVIDELQVAARIQRSRRRRRGYLAAARVGLLAVGLLAVVAIIRYAQVGSLSTWFTVAFAVLITLLGIVSFIAETTACPSCGGDPQRAWAWHFYSSARVCSKCGLDLYSDEASGS